MLLLLCSACCTAFRVIGEVRQIDMLIGRHSEYAEQGYRCPSCEGPTQSLLEKEVDPATMHAVQVIDLSPDEMFAALNGLGLPAEQDCSEEAVRQLFQEKRVRRAVGQPVFGTRRYFVDYLEFEDGTRAYFGASQHGAIIYRITRPANYTAKALDV